MSILDGMPSSEAELKTAMAIADPAIERFLGELNLTPRQQSVIDLLKEGFSLADIYRISREERDALFLKGGRLIQVGHFQKARDCLTYLYQLEPLDARVIYAIAVTYQAEGDVSRAAKLYVQFLALDATNAEGYLRLGECLMAAGEYDDAADSFKIAKAECERGNGTRSAAALADKMLAELRVRR